MKKAGYIISTVLFFSGSLLADPGRSIGPSSYRKELQEYAKLGIGTLAAVCLYGIANDQVTARVCPEYFTEGFHRDMVLRWPDGWMKNTLLTTDSPTKLGLLWGPLATWRLGALYSIPVMLAARAGLWPKLAAKDLAKPTLLTMLGVGLCVLCAGIHGYNKAVANPSVEYYDFVKDRIVAVPLKDHYKSIAGNASYEAMNGFIADLYAHRMAYGCAPYAAAGLIGWMLYKRYSLHKEI